jgi:hypothetical protein
MFVLRIGGVKMARLVLVLCVVAVVMCGCICCPCEDEVEELVWIEYRVESESRDVSITMQDETGEIVELDDLPGPLVSWGYEWPEAVPCGTPFYLSVSAGGIWHDGMTVDVYRNGYPWTSARVSGFSSGAVSVIGVS